MEDFHGTQSTTCSQASYHGTLDLLSSPGSSSSYAQTRFRWLIKPHCSHGVRTGSQRRTLAPSDDVPHARERCANFGLAATQRAIHAQTQQTTPRAHASYSSQGAPNVRARTMLVRRSLSMVQPFSGFGGSVGLWSRDALVDLACRGAHASGHVRI